MNLHVTFPPLARLFATGYTGCMASQQPFVPPMRSGNRNGMTNGNRNGMTNGGGDGSVSGSIHTFGSGALGSGGKGINEEDEKRQTDDLRYRVTL